MNNKIILASLLVSSLAMGGCFFHGGSHEHFNTSPTLGQELTDLQIAFDKGAISQQEYEREKAKLLRAQRQTRSAQHEL